MLNRSKPRVGFVSDPAVAAKTAGRPESASDLDGLCLDDILSAVAANPVDADERIRALEDRIRRQWATMRELVREHGELLRGRVPDAPVPVRAEAPVLNVVVTNPRPRTRSMVPPPRRLRPVG